MQSSSQASCLTSEAPAAIAVLSVAGREAEQAIARCWKPAGGAAELRLNQIRFGHWASGEDVVVCRTADYRFEIHCHGGAAAKRAILADLQNAGAETAKLEDVLNSSSPDAIAADAAFDLIRCTSINSTRVLLNQANGMLSQKIQELIKYDISDSGPRSGELSYRQIENALLSLIRAGSIGVRLIDPPKVAIVGLPSSGKSTLLNKLLGWQRAIVHETPGTTRDLLAEAISLNCWPLVLVDSAGLRDSANPIEQMGVDRVLHYAESVDLVLMLVDAAAPPDDQWQRWYQQISDVSAGKIIVAASKIDLIEECSANQLPPHAELGFSSASGAGMPDLINTLVERLGFSACSLDGPVPFRRSQLDWLHIALERLREFPREGWQTYREILSAVLSGLNSERP